MLGCLPDECKNMEDVRAEIDLLDEKLIGLLAERYSFVVRASQLKQSSAEALVPWRVEQVIEQVREHSNKVGVPPDLAEAVWRRMIDWFIGYEDEQLESRPHSASQTSNGR
jgi:isochorismate pyruvate lyase